MDPLSPTFEELEAVWDEHQRAIRDCEYVTVPDCRAFIVSVCNDYQKMHTWTHQWMDTLKNRELKQLRDKLDGSKMNAAIHYYFELMRNLMNAYASDLLRFPFFRFMAYDRAQDHNVMLFRLYDTLRRYQIGKEIQDLAESCVFTEKDFEEFE